MFLHDLITDDPSTPLHFINITLTEQWMWYISPENLTLTAGHKVVSLLVYHMLVIQWYYYIHPVY